MKFDGKIKYHNPILINGLIALCLNAHDSHVKRRVAIDSMVTELELVKFCKNNSDYNDPVKTATAIINGLTEKGWVNREYSVSRVGNPVREGVKGYNLTSDGLNKLLELKPTLPKSVIKRIPEQLWQPLDASTNATVAPAEPQPQPISKIERMKRLFDALNARNLALAECVAVCAAQKAKIEQVDAKIAPIQKEIDALEAQLELKKQQIIQDSKAKQDLETELKAYLDIQAEEEQAVAGIRQEMESLIV